MSKDYRLILHQDRARAAVWDLDPLLDGDPHALRLIDNFDASFSDKDLASQNWTVSLAGFRNGVQLGYWLGVSPKDFPMPVTAAIQ